MVIDTHILLVQIVTKRPNREQHSDPQLNLQPSNAKVKVMSTILEGGTKESRSPNVSVLHPETLRSEKLCKRIVSRTQWYVPMRRFLIGRLTVSRCDQLTGLQHLVNNISIDTGSPGCQSLPLKD